MAFPPPPHWLARILTVITQKEKAAAAKA